MKKLQNNFTTPEQSKRLLNLGVPANSADLYWHLGCEELIWVRNTKSELREDLFDILIYGKTANTPIWSEGRLIEIITICREEIYTRLLFSRVDDHTNIENLIHYISAEIENGHIDFSKLDNYDTRN